MIKLILCILSNNFVLCFLQSTEHTHSLFTLHNDRCTSMGLSTSIQDVIYIESTIILDSIKGIAFSQMSGADLCLFCATHSISGYKNKKRSDTLLLLILFARSMVVETPYTLLQIVMMTQILVLDCQCKPTITGQENFPGMMRILMTMTGRQ